MEDKRDANTTIIDIRQDQNGVYDLAEEDAATRAWLDFWVPTWEQDINKVKTQNETQ